MKPRRWFRFSLHPLDYLGGLLVASLNLLNTPKTHR